MKLKRIITGSLLALTMAFGVGVGVGANKKAEVKVAKADDYSSTIRVYVDLTGFGTIDYVRIGSKEATNNCVLTSSNAKYNQSLGQYVFDLSAASHYDKMGFYFSEYSTWWQYEYDDGWVWIDGGFDPGYEYQFKNVQYKSGGGPKYFNCEKYKIGEITDNVSNPTLYFVDGYSWHSSGNVYVHFWGGTASSTYPGSAMTDTGLRLKAYVGETEYSGLHIYKFTISGSVAYVQFNNNSSKTGDLRPVNGKVYFYGVSAETYGDVTDFLVSTQSKMGSYTYGGKSFTKSICALSQAQAKTFVDTYDDLAANHGSGVASSVAGSGIVTYTSPETSTSTTGEVSLADIRAQLVKKYPSIVSGAAISPNITKATTNSVIVVVVVSLTAIAAAGFFFFFYRKNKIQ